MELSPGAVFPDLDLPDHTGRERRLGELAGGDPVVLLSSRGWWCPKEQRYMRELCRLQDELEVAYSRISAPWSSGAEAFSVGFPRARLARE